jgi:hypothetical protein
VVLRRTEIVLTFGLRSIVTKRRRRPPRSIGSRWSRTNFHRKGCASPRGQLQRLFLFVVCGRSLRTLHWPESEFRDLQVQMLFGPLCDLGQVQRPGIGSRCDERLGRTSCRRKSRAPNAPTFPRRATSDSSQSNVGALIVI